MADIKVGQVTHYYDQVGVAILTLEADLAVGDKIKIVRGTDESIQEVNSMEVEHQKVDKAKKGDEIGLKVDQPAKSKALIYKVS